MGDKLSHKLSKYRNSHQNSSLSNNVYFHASNETKVVSKYFKPSTVSMDESFSDFQVPKKIVRPAKNKPQTKTSKVKLKKCKGQKDLRKALKSDIKKSDIVTYTKDFDAVCTNLGIDVDPGQLELAVALSTSLAEYKDKDLQTQNPVCDFQTSNVKPCLSQSSRITKIKSTLQEYGFKLKKNHISIPVNSRKRKGKRYIKYNLINKSKEDKAQIIADKFSQILFDGLVNTQCHKQDIKKSYKISSGLEEFYRLESSVYNKSNYTFAECENDNLYFYTNNLVEISTYKIGCLLRDWSAIPGRPPSPIRRRAITTFETRHLMHNQDDLDKILSSTVDICRTLIQPFLDKDTAGMEELEVKDDHNIESLKEINDVDIRSNSPDIFDEESLDVIKSPMNKIECNSDDELPAIKLSISNEKFTQNNFEETTQVLSTDNLNVTERGLPGKIFSPSLDSKYHLNLEESNDSIVKDAMINIEEEITINLTQTFENVEIDLHSSSFKNIDFVDLSQSSNQLDTIEVKTDSIFVTEDKLDQSRVEGDEQMMNKSEAQSIDLTQDSVYGTRDFILKYNDNKSLSLPSETTDPPLDKSNDKLFDNIKPDSEKDNLLPIESPIKYNSQSSVYSEVFEISDEEVNYSMNHRQSDESITEMSKHETNSNEGEKYRKSENFDLYGSSLFDQIPTSFSTIQHSIRNSLNTKGDYCSDRESYLPEVVVGNRKNETKTEIPIQQIVTPVHAKSGNRISTIDTATPPSNSEYIIKIKNITPMMDYKSLTTPERNKELSKYGLKPFKRKRAVQFLEHLYYQTHPLMEGCDKLQDSDYRTKIRKLSNIKKLQSSPCKIDQYSAENVSPKSVTHKMEDQMANDLLFEGNEEKSERLEVAEEITEMDIYEVTDNTPVIKNLLSDAFEWVFQKREKSKVQGCRVPLHIAFHNYVSARRHLKDAILRYEPIRIDIVHKQLVDEGFRYDSKDLLKFMDKKCITVKTLDKSQCVNKRKQLRKTPTKRKQTRDIS